MIISQAFVEIVAKLNTVEAFEGVNVKLLAII
jgi:hypothetical protein